LSNPTGTKMTGLHLPNFCLKNDKNKEENSKMQVCFDLGFGIIHEVIHATSLVNFHHPQDRGLIPGLGKIFDPLDLPQLIISMRWFSAET